MTTTTRKPQRTAARCTVPPPAQVRGQRPEASPAGRRHPNPARGLRGDFHKVTITLPLDTLWDLRVLGLTRRAQGTKSTPFTTCWSAPMASHRPAPRRAAPYCRQEALSGVTTPGGAGVGRARPLA